MTSMRNKKNTGFGLIEVLITLLILAIGLLGIAALQYRGLQFSHDAYLRSQINMLAYDIADKIRMQSDDVTLYDAAVTNWVVPVARPAACDFSAATTAAVVATGNSAQIVNTDVACWQQQVYDALPPGSIADIVVTDAANQIYTVTLTWQDRELVPHTVAYTFRP